MTNTLLFLILLTLLILLAVKWNQYRQISAQIDAIGEMLGDMLRELITATKDKTQ